MEVTYTDGRGKDLGVIKNMKLDVDFGDESNSFEIALPTSSNLRLETGALIYVEGTEYGGRVTRPGVRTADKELVYGGPTWHGLLAERPLAPDPNEDYVIFTGEANSAIAFILSKIDTGGLFVASDRNTGVNVTLQTRYTNAWKAICTMLDQVGMRPKIRYWIDHVIVEAVPYVVYETDSVNVEMSDETVPVNHLICLGKGNLKDRSRVDLFADRAGNISTTQTIFGIDYNAQVYDYANADDAELLKSGTEKLSGMQDASKVSISLNFESLEDEYSIGDRLYSMDDSTGISATVPIGQKTVTISSTDKLTVSYGPRNGSENVSYA